MKRIITLLISIIALSHSYAQGPVVTYPNGGEVFTVGDVIDITWTNSPIGDIVGVDYTIDNWGNTNWLNTNYSNPVANSYQWTVPNSPGTQCKVGVFNTSFQGDISDGFFTIQVAGATTLVTSITLDGQSGVSTISSPSGTLQMIETVLPANTTDNSVSWSVSNGTGSASIGASGLLTAISDGTVTVTATANDGSGVTGDMVITISNQSAGIKSNDFSPNIRIHPNPGTGIFNVGLSSDEVINGISVYNDMGQLVYSNGSLGESLNLSHLPKGIYILKVITNHGTATQKLIIK